ncbi:hypothetical protein ACFPOE_23910 [Caenimonas terrae]|uniref:DUF202 domain-containing protein n=1 Tax=Caenimonas terrae TaxID=696074 RepID=A0ABW0NJQ9_9BURK
MPTSTEDDDRKAFFQNYADYSKAVRAWLVAYGIGGPVLFVTNDKLTERVAKSGYGNEIIALFLVGVGLQIVSAMVNKWASWHIYRGIGDDDYRSRAAYRFWGWINDQTWIDIWADLLALVALVFATWRVLNVFIHVGNAV